MTVKIHGFAASTCTKRVALTLKELNIPYEIVLVDSASEMKSPAHLEHQPFGQVPYIVDEDGFELYESRAIARYIVAKYGKESGLIPQDLRKLAKFEQAASIEAFNFDPYASGIVFEKLFAPMKGFTTDEARAEKLAVALDAKLAAYETILSKQKYLAGDEITLADLFHLPYGTLLAVVGNNALTDAKRPNLARWWSDITSRPTWQSLQVAK